MNKADIETKKIIEALRRSEHHGTQWGYNERGQLVDLKTGIPFALTDKFLRA